jgi:hypothetical protein
MSTIITHRDTSLGVYPLLTQHPEWAIIHYKVGDKDEIDQAHKPTIRVTDDANVIDLYIEGQDAATFSSSTGLEFSMPKGPYVFSKRFKRAVLRPYYIYGLFESAKIVYLPKDARTSKVWDGAARISRDFLKQMTLAGKPRKIKRLAKELDTIERVEFTLMSAKGQDKGHAVVVDTNEYDLMLPSDTKTDVKYTKGYYVGINPVHGNDQMRLDIQSLVNLNHLFNQEDLMRWLNERSALQVRSIENGEMTGIGRSLGPQDIDKATSWHVLEYLMSGGHPMWFPSIIKGIANQYVKLLKNTTRDGMRLPCPGGRLYIMVDEVGLKSIPQGQIKIDIQAGTIWVNAEDWISTISRVLGGADQDDACWTICFRDDVDQKNKVLFWRSPNQLGEWMVLEPTEDSDIIKWETIDGESEFPTLDSSKLPTRIDLSQQVYLKREDGEQGLIDPKTSLSPSTYYDMSLIDKAIERARGNAGALGAYVNTMMVFYVMFDRLPKQLPDLLENVIDGTVKLGYDLSPVMDWCKMVVGKLINEGQQFPSAMIARVIGLVPKSMKDLTLSTDDNWVDRTIKLVDNHIESFQEDISLLVKKASPPAEVFEAGTQWLEAGNELRQLYAEVLRLKGDYESIFEIARLSSERYLEKFNTIDGDYRGQVLLGAILGSWMQAEGPETTEACVWQIGEKITEGRKPGIAQMTLAALRSIGVIDEPVIVGNQVMWYTEVNPLDTKSATVVYLNGTWFNLFKIAESKAITAMGDVPIEDRKLYKSIVATLAHMPVESKIQIGALSIGGFVGRELTISQLGERKVACYKPSNLLFAYVAKGQEARLVRDTITIKSAFEHDGNLHVIAE